ncbi:MAG: ATP-binding protein [Proteobacteria bacterium]|jgi:two-component system C4-dicarboxylate transport sensor histidine kinase DctB|nr:sensor histidine kinase [Paracoccaceae bacterium]MDA0319492.1 ATP-binding protein [Pseudomonadota bacterium]MDA0851743.1 ATP-binding protein [Pseudomonadota bacterium]MDA1294545.1 ATP-binding protein [Pseudomonadota bacterium]
MTDTGEQTLKQGRLRKGRSFPWRLPVVLFIFLLISIVTLWVSNAWLTERFSESMRNKLEVRLTLYSGNLKSELQRNSIVPKLLARDQELIGALHSQDFSTSTQRLIDFVDEIGAASLMLLDKDGRTVASTDRNNLGSMHREKAFFVEATRSNETVFTIVPQETGGVDFYYSRRIEFQNRFIGVVSVEVDLHKFERAWAGISDSIMVIDSEGKIILATDPRWRGVSETEALAKRPAETALSQAVQFTAGLTGYRDSTYVQGEAVMRIAGRVPFRGWQIVSFTAFSSVREKVNSILALEVMGFTLMLAMIFYLANRRTRVRLKIFENESAELRRLNERLQREIAEREKVQKTLEVAEQSLEQSSKLAALGEMAAAVSHELNQPLAAMKTYLAGAGLLLSRNRPDETLSAFHRIDDLIERMGAITRQLKTYARKGSETFSPVDMSAALSSSLSMMEPQLKHSNIRLEKVISEQSVVVIGDRVRLEQVLINLLRNAVDAVKTVPDPVIEIMLSRGETVTLSVRDNGSGIEELDLLFEPFHTTKKDGDGVGLGLAISSGIVKDHGGRLTARNSDDGGAVFEVQLPAFRENTLDYDHMEVAE